MRIASVNVNGIRAAIRKGMADWVATAAPDVITMQEVRAPDELLGALLGELPGAPWHLAHSECAAKGRSGVAIASRTPLVSVVDSIGVERFNGQGRWIEAEVSAPSGPLTVVSAYVHTGDATDAARMEEKHAFLEALADRVEKLRAEGREVLLTGDLNVAHQQVDLKNWKGNLTNAGFLPEERAHFDRWFNELGWIDLGRRFGGDGPGPYSWWSYRGRAFDNDAGWRIDYALATPGLAAAVADCTIHRAPEHAARWSDHAPVVVDLA